MAPPAKKRKTQQDAEARYACFCCGSTRSSHCFPDYNPSPDCEHLINTCKTCLKKWVQVQVDAGLFVTGGEKRTAFGIKCPQCEEGIMRNVNVQMASLKKVHEKFEEAERKHIADSTPGWRWCLNPVCSEGQVHDPVTEAALLQDAKQIKQEEEDEKSKSAEETHICTCHKCGARACVTCDRPWHEGETCAGYQERIKDRVVEEDQSLRLIQRKTKPCPHCKKKIEKNGGCPVMACTCGNYFCWTCGEKLVRGMCGCTRQRQQEQAMLTIG